ncbi:MAG: AsmA-like C-terminal region-containing protein [Nitrosomonadales bacterium]
MNDLHINARNQGGVLTAQLSAKEINGELSWQPDGEGKLVARLKNLTLGQPESWLSSANDTGKKEEVARLPSLGDDASATEFPALDLKVDDLSWKDKQLGKMELLARQHGSDWQLEHMHITNPDGVLTAHGIYRMAEGKSQTQVNLKLEITDAGKILSRSGYPDSVKDGSGTLEGEFTWRGGPDDFSYATLDGNLKLDTDKGQFSEN